MSPHWIDIGDDHAISYYSWKPDDLPENREHYGVPLPNIAKAGAFVRHRKPDGSECMGSVQFDITRSGEAPEGRALASPVVGAADDLTLPALLLR